MALTAEGLYYAGVLAFIFAGAVFREFNLLILLAGMMTGPWLLSIWLAPAGLRRLDVDRSLPNEVGAGEVINVHLAVRSRSRWLDSWGIRIEDRVQCVSGPMRIAPRSMRLVLPRVVAKQTTATSYQVRMLQRGRYRIGPLSLETSMPLGLWRAERQLPLNADFVVYPQLGELTPNWRRRLAKLESIGQSSIAKQGMIDGDYYGLRDWRSGDSRRWIHWRTSARRNELAVRQFERQTNQDMTILLDLRCSLHDAQRQQAIETAISFAASVIADFCRRGHSRLTLGTTGSPPRWLSGYASAGVRRDMLQWLAVVPFHEEDYFPQLLETAAAHLAAGRRLLAVTADNLDLTDTERFGALWDDPAKQRILARVDCLNVRSQGFRQLFDLEPIAGETAS